MSMITVKLEYNSDTEIAKYSILKDNELYDEECVIELKLPFAQANALSYFLNELIFVSDSEGYSSLLMKVSKFVEDHYKS